MTLKVGMQHSGLKLYKVYKNDDIGLTLTYFTSRSKWVTYTFEWENSYKFIYWGKLAANDSID